MAYFPYGGKSIFYEEFGQGSPVLFLHGNTASSKMFELLMPLYAEKFRCILLDFLGNGRSDRVERFSPDLWQEEARQTIALVEYLQCGKVSLVGTSGGAWVAVNTALKRPDLVEHVIADSFDGRTLHDGFAENLRKEREYAKQDHGARQFYEWCQGEDWEKVVDLNTQALITCAVNKTPLFCKPLESLDTPILFMGSLEDGMCRQDMLEEYKEMDRLVGNGKIYMFETGGHPAVLSNAESAARVITDFLNDQS